MVPKLPPSRRKNPSDTKRGVNWGNHFKVHWSRGSDGLQNHCGDRDVMVSVSIMCDGWPRGNNYLMTDSQEEATGDGRKRREEREEIGRDGGD